MKNLFFLVLLSTIFFTACSTKQQIPKKVEEEKAKMVPTSFDDIEGFYDDDLDHALNVFKKDCLKAKRFELFRDVCEKAESETDGKDFFTSNFQPYKLYDRESRDEGTITGYYEPLLNGSLKKTKRYKYPVYKMPKNLITSDDDNVKDFKSIGKIVKGKVVPYDTREQIENNPNNPNYQVLAYVDDKFDLSLMHIQGSGKIRLDTGRIINVGYAGQNGRKFTGMGTYMLNMGYISRDELSIQTIKKYFEKNPSKLDEVLNQNESYVFFKLSNQGATGSLGSLLTAERNLAVDRSVIPLGAPVFLNTKNPVSKIPINRLMVAADVGGAIKGDIRADFFWGFGENALEYAGRMKEKGKMYVLMPKK